VLYRFRIHDQALSEQVLRGAEAVFSLEDKLMIEAQQQMMGNSDLWSLNPVFLAADSGPVQVRRVLEKLIDEEALRSSELPPPRAPQADSSAPGLSLP
jgi:hypothetical protein